MKPKESPTFESPSVTRVLPSFSLNGILLCHILATIVALFTYPFWIWSQLAMVGFWLALGRGMIWWRLLWIALGFLLVGISFRQLASNGIMSALLWNIAFAGLFTGVGAMVLGQNAGWTLLPVRFRFWELLVGAACLGFAYFVVESVGNFEMVPSHQWQRIYFTLIHTSLLGLGTAAIGMTLMARPGLPRRVVRYIALLCTLSIPWIDYVACELLTIELFDVGQRVYFYLTNLAIVWVTVLLYQDAVNSGERMIFETNCDQEGAEESDDAS